MHSTFIYITCWEEENLRGDVPVYLLRYRHRAILCPRLPDECPNVPRIQVNHFPCKCRELGDDPEQPEGDPDESQDRERLGDDVMGPEEAHGPVPGRRITGEVREEREPLLRGGDEYEADPEQVEEVDCGDNEEEGEDALPRGRPPGSCNTQHDGNRRDTSAREDDLGGKPVPGYHVPSPER